MIQIDNTKSGIAVITLDRPNAANALTLPMVAELRGAIDTLEADGTVRVVVLAANGKVFCGGLDLKAVLLGEDAPQGPIENMALQEHFAGLMLAVRNARFPVIAAVGGAAVGAGMGLALAADVRVAGISAKFLVGAVKVGLSAGECGISYHLPRLIGVGRAHEIMLTGRPVAADEAMSCGLVTSIADDPLVAALDVAQQIAANSPYAIKHTKQVMHANVDASSLESAIELENHIQCVALLSEDFKEACQAFGEKRKPVFRGR